MLLEVIVENYRKYNGFTDEQADRLRRDIAMYALAAVMSSKVCKEAEEAVQGNPKQEQS